MCFESLIEKKEKKETKMEKEKKEKRRKTKKLHKTVFFSVCMCMCVWIQ